MRRVFAFFAGLTVLSTMPLAAQAAGNCPAGSFVLNAGQAFAGAARKGSASAFIGAASRYARADEGEYVRLAQSFMGRFMARYASNFNVSGLKVTTCSANIVTATSSGGKKVIFRVGKGRGGYRVQDVNVSSIWLAGQMRSKFVSVLNRNNGDISALLKFLRD
jgi:hypothetical protein